MEITPRELRDVEIRESFRGYSRDEVNELLERAAASIDAANERMQQLSERLSAVQSETGHTRETEDILHRTLLLAQRAADEAVGEATAKSRQMLDDAEIQARRVIADAEADARRRGETERRRLEEEVLDLAGRRDALLADVEALTRFEADYRDRMVRALEADLSALRSRPAAAPGTRPEPSDVEIPVLSEGFARREPSDAPGNAFAPPAGASSPAPTPSYVTSSAPGISLSESDTEDAPEASTQAIDIQDLFDRANANASAATGSALAFEQPAAAATTTTTTSPATESAAPVGDTIDAESLDDDAFFATLREAVHDDTPLGPREDLTGEDMFFDAEAESTGFRDVFRRRR